MDVLTAAEREFLLLAYGAGARTVSVSRRAGPTEARLTAGRRRLAGGSRLRALASLYSRGIVAQTALNRFALTPTQDQGVNVARAKLTAMAMSSFLTAFAGTFWAQFTLYIHPKSVMSLDSSFEIAFIALIGGRGSIAGPVLGALLLRPVSDFSRIYFGDKLPGLHLIIFGFVLILVMLFQPRGLQLPLPRIYHRVMDRLFGDREAAA